MQTPAKYFRWGLHNEEQIVLHTVVKVKKVEILSVPVPILPWRGSPEELLT